MINLTFTDRNGKTFKRVDKRQARKIYETGKNVVLMPCNLRPFNDYFPFWITLNKNDINELRVNETGFNRLVNEYEFYNCINNETGKHSAFYVEFN